MSARSTWREAARPLTFDFDLEPKLLVPVLGWDGYLPAVRAIAARARIEAAADPNGGWLHYSRRAEWYSTRRRYLHPEQTLTHTIRAVDILESAGLIEHEKAQPSSYKKQSRLRASRKLLTLVPATAPFEQGYDAECIILYSRKQPADRNAGKPAIPATRIPYIDTPETIRMRENLQKINEAISDVTLSHPRLGVIKPGMPTRLSLPPSPTGKKRWADGGPARMRMERKFTETFDLHGRFYAWYQNWPEDERINLLIDGEKVVELDYPQHHPTILYAERGIKLPDGYDAYGAPSKEHRALMKVAFNAAVNARNRRLEKPIRDKVRELVEAGKLPPDFALSKGDVKAMLAVVEAEHKQIGDAFFSDAGMRLMRIDSDMAEAVMLELVGKGIVAFGVHDSFIVKARHEGALKEAMARAKAMKLDQLGGQNVLPFQQRERTKTAARKPLKDRA
jgi:hypothetical protein